MSGGYWEFYRLLFPGAAWDFARCEIDTSPASHPCSACGGGWTDFEDEPLRISWDRKGPAVLPDFTGFGRRISRLLISNPAAAMLRDQCPDVEIAELDKPPPKWLKDKPDDGPLHMLRVEALALDPDVYAGQLGWSVDNRCAHCGHASLVPPGWSMSEPEAAREEIPFNIREEDTRGLAIFALDSPFSRMFLRHDAKEQLISAYMSGIASSYAGCLIPPGRVGTKWWIEGRKK